MTTKWEIPADLFKGQSVAILGAAPAMTEELAATMKGCKAIAVNRALQFAPWADMFVCLDPDPEYWALPDQVEFAGIRVCGIECDIDAMYAGMFYESVATARGQLEIRNNTLAALRIAERGGAKKIILLGIDAPRYDHIHASTGFYGFAEGLQQVISELTAKGVNVSFRGDDAGKKKK